MSSEGLLTRTRVLRGAAAAQVRGAGIGADLSARIAAPAVALDADQLVRDRQEEAARVGYEDGYAAGLREAADASRAQLDATADRLAQALRAVEAAAEDLQHREAAVVADVERHIVALAVDIAGGIIGRELAATDLPVREALQRALSLAPARADVTVRLHPSDLDLLGDAAGFAPERTVTVVADAGVEQGGCVVDAGPCRIDAQIGPALERVREVLQA